MATVSTTMEVPYIWTVSVACTLTLRERERELFTSPYARILLSPHINHHLSSYNMYAHWCTRVGQDYGKITSLELASSAQVLTEAAYSSMYYPWPTNKDSARNYVRDTGQLCHNMHITVYVVADIPPPRILQCK
jgi:hypothetical protein